MHAPPRRLAGVALVAVALAVTTAAAAAPTPARGFVASGNASCHAYETALRRLPPFDDLLGAAAFFTRAHPLSQRFLRELRQLTPPPAKAVAFARLLRLVEASTRLDLPLQLAARRGDGTTFTRHLSEMQALEGPIRAAARKLSLTACLWR